MAETVVLTQRTGKGEFLLFAIIVVILGGISGVAYSATEAAPSSTKELSDSFDETMALAFKEKEEFEQYIRKQIHDLEDNMQALKNKSTDLHETTQSKFNEQLETLKEQKKEILLKIEDFRHSSENRWKDIRESILHTMNDLKESLPQPSSSQ